MTAKILKVRTTTRPALLMSGEQSCLFRGGEVVETKPTNILDSQTDPTLVQEEPALRPLTTFQMPPIPHLPLFVL